MEYITLKNTDLRVSRLCIGGDPMGGHGWGIVSEADIKQAINTAVDNGLNFFDTADTYGLGKAETILGETLGSRKNDVIIASKFGVRWTDDMKSYFDNSPEWIEQALVGSMKRLKRDYIDIYQLHWRDYKTPLDSVFNTLLKAKGKGYIRCIGLSNIKEADIPDFIPYKQYITTIQDEYSLANRENEKVILDFTEGLDVNPMTWGSLGQGILTGKYDRNTVFDSNDRRSRAVYKNFHGENLVKNLRIVDEMRLLSQIYNKSLSAIAIRFILDYLTDSVVITGVKNSVQVADNIEALNWSLQKEHIELLEKVSDTEA